MAKWSLWVLGILFVLQNFGLNVTSIIAGLGIGGIAIALAAQNILSDLFSSFSIAFDKPFEPGDFIVVGETSGTVQRIGLKTTRIQSLEGEEIILPNAQLTDARVQNYGRMEQRRVRFALGVEYATPQEKLRRIPDLVRSTVESANNTRFDRSHFKVFGDSALEFENVYYVRSGDYAEYMDINQEVLLNLNEALNREGIMVAFPTRTVHVAKEE
ncbi:MAG: mechanosensitive ion channel family protein [Candidatus Spechtbacterales bacterium]